MGRASQGRVRHVLITTDAVGGVWTYALDLAAGLIDAGIKTTLAVIGPHPSTSQRSAAHRGGAALIELGGPLDWTAPGPGALAASAGSLSDLVARLRPDVLHLNSPALAGYATFDAPVLGACHSCLATWWSAVRGGRPPEDFVWRIRATAAGYSACDRLVAPSRAFAAATAAAYGIPAPEVVHNGRRDAGARAHDVTDPIVLTAGRLWDDGKGIRTLDLAAAAIEARFVALGAITAPDGSRVLFSSLETPGPVDASEVAGWMGRSQVFASAALYEPFGLAVLEAAQAGLPLVLSDIPTFRELWDGAALFVPPNDAAGFSKAIGDLLDVPDRRRTLAQDSVARSRRYGLATMIAGYEALYERLGHRREAAAGTA